LNLFLHYSPFWLKAIFPNYIWHISTHEKVLYLTFDDGPIPEITEFVLETLNQYNAKATFFCIGDNVRKHPSVFQQLIDNKHSIGNHTFNHKNGWKTETSEYIANFQLCSDQLNLATDLFRPPYGRIRKEQAALLPESTKVIMWDVLSGDFSQNILPEVCLKKSIRHTRPGSIILFHDSIKAYRNLSHTLPRFLQHFSELGYRFEALPMDQRIKN
jgi:peptidoglycan/xylan/chitin deacetylase (PgdA/CDA1 family)